MDGQAFPIVLTGELRIEESESGYFAPDLLVGPDDIGELVASRLRVLRSSGSARYKVIGNTERQEEWFGPKVRVTIEVIA